MAIPKKYDKRMRQSWGMHAVWFPGTKISVGDIVQKAKDGTFQPVGKLKNFGVDVKTTKSEALKTGFKSAATKVRFFQGGVEVPAAKVDVVADANVEMEFTSADSFIVSTPIGSVVTIDNLLSIGNQVTGIANWSHSKWFIVRQVLTANGFSVLGSEKRGRKLGFSGKGRAVLDFATLGLTAGIKKTGNVQLDVEFLGKKGALAIDLAQVKKNGLVVVG